MEIPEYRSKGNLHFKEVGRRPGVGRTSGRPTTTSEVENDSVCDVFSKETRARRHEEEVSFTDHYFDQRKEGSR